MIEDKQVRLLVVLSAAVLAVGLVYALRPAPDEKLPWDQQATEQLWSIEAADVVYLRVESEQGLVVAEREGESPWTLSEPMAVAADRLRMRAALDDLTSLQTGIPMHDADPATMGLGDVPRGLVTLRLSNGTEHTLRIGDAAPIGWSTYVQREDGLLMVVPRHLDDSLLDDPQRFRDHNAFNYLPSDVVAGDLVSPYGTIGVFKDESGEWWQRGYTRADGSSLDMFFLGLLELRFDQILDGASPDGIDEPRFVAKVTTSDGVVHELLVGSELPNGGTFVQAPGGTQGIIDPERMRILSMGPTDFGDNYAFPVRRDGADRLDVTLGDLSASLRGGEGRWTWDGHSQEQAIELANTLRAVTITYTVGRAVPEPGASTGRVTVGIGDDRLHMVELGQSVSPGLTGAKDVSGGEPYLVPSDQLDRVRELLASPPASDEQIPAQNE